MSMLFAATYPERTTALVLCGSEVKDEKTPDWPWGDLTANEFEQYLEEGLQYWGEGRSIQWLLPSRADDAELRAWLGRLQIESMTPRGVAAIQRIAFGVDVRDVAQAINVPTLILHRVDDQTCDVGNGRWLAQHIPLQLDSTVLYGLNAYGIIASDQQLNSSSPYNTYRHQGLTPGPIDSPGAAAIQAVLKPATGNWIYFVTVNPKTGETLFTASQTQFEQYRAELEHNLAHGQG